MGRIIQSMILICLLGLIYLPLDLTGITTSAQNTGINKPDSLKLVPDSLKQSFIKISHNYRIKKQNNTYQLNWLNQDYDYLRYIYTADIVDNDLYDVTKDVYQNFYLKKVELYNYNNTIYFYLDIKNAQTNKGALQFKIPLPNFHYIFEDKRTLED